MLFTDADNCTMTLWMNIYIPWKHIITMFKGKKLLDSMKLIKWGIMKQKLYNINNWGF